MNRLVASIADLSPQQRALLELRLLKKSRTRTGAAVERRPRTSAGVPLSFAQERLWFLQQLLPDSTAYNVRNAVRLRGRLDMGVLARTLGEIVRRHEVLGSTFPLDGERPVQIVAPWRPFPLAQVDLAGIGAQRRDAEAVRLVTEFSSLTFDLLGGPVFRALHLRLAEEEHVVLLTLHHIVADGWSMEILTRELATLYAVFARGEPSPLPELPIQYADFALWQREWLQGEVLEAQLGVWKRRLQGAPEVIELPTDRPRPSTQSFRGASLSFELPASLQSALRELGRRQGTTLFMTALAAFQVLLHRYTEQDDLVVGTPIAGRNRVEIENLIGCFVNTLVLRLSLSGVATCLELLAGVREVSLEAYAHQDLPFEKLVEELQPKRSLSHQPLFQVVFALDDSAGARSAAQDAALLPFEVESASTKFDWVLMMEAQRGRLSGSWSYNTDLFDRSSMMRTIDHLTTLLEGFVREPGGDPARLPMLSAAERHQVVIEWNDTEAPPAAARFLHDLFEAQVERTPDALAVLSDRGQLTYREVDQRANQLAHALRRLGVGPGASVAVLLERSLEMVPALLAILKAGGAYVPLEPIFGKARIHWILSTLETRWILTQTTQLPLLEELDELPVLEHVLCLDAALPMAETSRASLLRDPAAERAYTIYTSGSTGVPKGVQVCHRPVINLIDWVTRTFEVGSGDRLLFTTSLCFDLSVYDIFGILAAGGSVRIVSGEEARDPARLLEILLQEPITFWDSAPAALQQLVPFFPTAAGVGGDRLRLVFLSGDWIPVTLPDRVRAVFPRARVISLGGATEATVWSNDFPIGTVDPRWSSIPYGRPIQNARYHILDPHLSPCPVRVPGELFIAGGCLSDGYANEPVLTAQKYMPDPFSAEAGARMYRTGDRARLFPDGNIEFLGRLDHQVKIRGFRIELGDVEVTLRQHPAVQDVVVVARGDRPTDMRLVAYFVPGGGERPIVSALRTFLQNRLPAYMVPAAFVGLESFPVTSNGKLDRQSLPAVEWSRPDDGREALPRTADGRVDRTALAHIEASGSTVLASFAPPRDAVELQLVQIWEEVLGVNSVGIHDDFFASGGHSLSAVQVMARIKERFGLDLPLATLFGSPTIEGLAVQLRQSANRRPPSTLVSIQPRGSQRPFFCIHGIGGEVLIYYDLARCLGTTRPVYGIQAPLLTEMSDCCAPLEELAAEYLQAIREVQSKGPYFLGGYSYGSSVAFEMAQQLKRSGEPVGLLAMLDGPSPLVARKGVRRSDVVMMAGLARSIARQSGIELSLPHEELQALPRNEGLDLVLTELHKAGLVPTGVDLTWVQRALQGVRLREEALQRYEPEPYDGTITLFRSSEIEIESARALQEIGVDVEDRTRGWDELSTRSVEVHYVPGYHATILTLPNVRILAALLKECLDRANEMSY